MLLTNLDKVNFLSLLSRT